MCAMPRKATLNLGLRFFFSTVRGDYSHTPNFFSSLSNTLVRRKFFRGTIFTLIEFLKPLGKYYTDKSEQLAN